MAYMGLLGEGYGKGVRYWHPVNLFLFLEVVTSVPISVKIDQEMRLWQCAQTDRHTDANHVPFYRVAQNKRDYLTVWIVRFILRHPVYAIAIEQITRNNFRGLLSENILSIYPRRYGVDAAKFIIRGVKGWACYRHHWRNCMGTI